MARSRSPNRDKAFEIYKEHKGNIKLIDIASMLNIKDTQVRKWKSQDQWDNKIKGTLPKGKSNVTNKKENKSSVIKEPIADEVKEVINNTNLTDKQRLFCIYYIKCFNATKAALKAGYSKETAYSIGFNLLKKVEIKTEIEKLKQNKLNRAMLKEEDIFQKYMDIAFSDITDYVMFGNKEIEYIDDDGNLKTTTISHVNIKNDYEVDGTLISEVSKGKDGVKVKLVSKEKALQWLSDHMDLGTAEQKARVEKLKAEINNLTPEVETYEGNYKGIPSTMIAPAFAKVIFDIENREHLEYVFPGGRGSTKSSFISLEIIDLIMKNETMHACVLRQVGDTLRTSVYQQVKWAISALDLEDEFNCTVSPLEITRKSTGQKIYFRGADDPDKIKSIKVPFGYIGIAWFEELDQFAGPEAVRKIEQSVVRGGDVAYIFKSFNPPKSANNWANKYIKIPKETRLVTSSTYLDVPKQWLGKPFLDEAEFLKEVNPDAYENEYMGVANGNGGNVFDNVEIRAITDEEINRFDRIYFGVDWGYYPDKYAYTKCYYNSSQLTLYILDEYGCNKKSNKETADYLIKYKGVKPNDKIVCDSAEPKSIADYKSYGLFARPAVKGPDSVRYSMKWLQSLKKIVIDNSRTPNCAEEFLNYEYERDKDDNVIEGYPDKNNHFIDSVRYGLEEVWRRRGR